jgi:hypothetical protein
MTLVATVIVLFIVYTGSIMALDRAGALPPPAIVNELCADEKLEWLRDNPHLRPNLLFVGSSIAWRDVDGEAFVRRSPDARPLNGGVCHAQMNQTAFVTGYLLRHFPLVRTVVSIVVPQDFLDCAHTPSWIFDPATADAYVFERRWSYGFYLSQFDPVALVRNATQIQAMRDGRNQFDSMVMSPYGDGPLRIEGSRGLLYGAIKGYDPACFAALHDLVAVAASGGRHVLVATGPLNPLWSARYDPDGRLRAALTAEVRAALQGTRAEFWDGAATFASEPTDFTDAIHINWLAAQRFSARLAVALDAGHGQP